MKETVVPEHFWSQKQRNSEPQSEKRLQSEKGLLGSQTAISIHVSKVRWNLHVCLDTFLEHHLLLSVFVIFTGFVFFPQFFPWMINFCGLHSNAANKPVTSERCDEMSSSNETVPPSSGSFHRKGSDTTS